MKQFLLVLALSVLPVTAYAQYSTRWCQIGGNNGRVLNGVALNGSAASRTFHINSRQCHSNTASFRYLVLEVEFTHTTSGNVLITCTTGAYAASADKTPQVCSGTGICTANDAGIISKAVTGNKKWAARIGVRGYRAWSCVASHDNTPAAGDVLTVRAYLTD